MSMYLNKLKRAPSRELQETHLVSTISPLLVPLVPTASGQAVVFVVGGEQPLELVRKVPLGPGQRSS